MPLDSVGGGIIAGALLVGGLLIVGACVWGLLGLMIMKDITPLEFVLYAGGLMGLVLLGMANVPPFGRSGIILAAGLAIGFPLMRRVAERRALDQMEEEDIRRHLDTIKHRPEIPYSYERLGDIYRKRCHYDLAAEFYEKHYEISGDRDTRHKAKRCRTLAAEGGRRKLCPDCTEDNPADARYCRNCGSTLPGVWEIIEVFRGDRGRRYLLTVVIAATAVGVLLGVVSQFHPIYANTCYLVAAAALVYYLYKRATAI